MAFDWSGLIRRWLPDQLDIFTSLVILTGSHKLGHIDFVYILVLKVSNAVHVLPYTSNFIFWFVSMVTEIIFADRFPRNHIIEKNKVQCTCN